MVRDNRIFFLIFIAFFFSIFFVIGFKSYLLPFLVVAFILFFLSKQSLPDSLYLLLLLSIPFRTSIRQWAVYASPPNDPEGYSFFYGITPKLIIVSIFLLILVQKKYRPLIAKAKSSLASICLFLFFVLATIGSLLYRYKTGALLVGYIDLVTSLLIFFFSSVYFSQNHTKKILQSYILSLLIFCTFFGLLQLVGQKPLGRFIELTPSFAQTSGYYTTDGTPQYRVSAFFSHPVYFGSFLSMLIPTIAMISLQYPFLISITLASLAVLLGTLSRSTWINIAAITYFIAPYKGDFKNAISKLNLKKYVIILLILAIPTGGLVIIRMKSIPTLFKQSSSGDVRLAMAKQSAELMANYPFFGVGLNNYVNEVSFGDKHTAAPVHNTLLILCSELGIPAGLLFALFVFLVMKKSYHPARRDNLSFGIWIGAFTFLISSQFHPLFTIDPSFDMFMLLMGYLSTLCL